MTDRELLYIIKIADHKSISNASNELHVAQPSLSQALNKIEEDLGTKLFIRKPRGVELTYAGEKYYLMAKQILNIYHGFEYEISFINDLKKGRLSIGTATYLGINILPNIIKRFSNKYPNIEVALIESDTQTLEELVLKGKIDLALTHTNENFLNKNINYNILEEDEFILVCAKNKSFDESAITIRNGERYINLKNINEKFIYLNRQKGIRRIVDCILKEQDIEPQIFLKTSNFEMAKRLACDDIGVTILPSRYLDFFKFYKNYDSYKILNSTNAYWKTCIITAPDVYMSKAGEIFIDEILKEINCEKINN